MSLHPDVERLALLGWRLHPASRTSRAACFKGAIDLATSDLDQLERWACEYPKANWRVVMAGSGIWALDVDRPSADHDADGIAALAGMVAENEPLPARPTSISGGGGCGLFWRDAGHPIRGKSGWPKPGLDPRAGRLTITVAPSIHLTTRLPYRWQTAPWEIDAPAAPGWLLRAVAPPPESAKPPMPTVYTSDRAFRRLRRALDNISSAPSGQANDTLNREAFAVARFVAAGKITEAEAEKGIYAAARARNIPDREARDTIRSAFRSGMRLPVEMHS